MTEFPTLCIGRCRPENEGGPRETGRRSWFCPTCADKARAKLLEVANTWPMLVDALAHPDGARDESGKQKHGMVSVGLVLNERVSDVMRGVGNGITFYTRVVMFERDATPPEDQSTPNLARWLATWHVDYFLTHEDEGIAAALVDDAHGYARMVRTTAFPSGAKRLETGVLCVEHATSEAGERTPCSGMLYVVTRPGVGVLPDLVCSDDDTHRVDPATWCRSRWQARHGRFNEAAARRLIETLGA